jgi:conserved oligomeric Golgi complex subunit 6
MTTDYFLTRKQSGLSDVVESPVSPANSLARSNPLTAKVTSVLSASYADSDIRDALNLLDKRGIQNSSETRRQLRLDVQKEVIESNRDIIREFGHVAEVHHLQDRTFVADSHLATQAYRAHNFEPKPGL